MSDLIVWACPSCGRTVSCSLPTIAFPPTTCYCRFPEAVWVMVQVWPPLVPIKQEKEEKEEQKDETRT